MKAVVLAILCVAGVTAIAAAALPSELQATQTKAQAGDAEAQFQLGEAYRGGKGVTADIETAIMWYRRAAGQGHIRASEELGFALFAHGDRREAMPYIEKAAARGEPRAFYLLGTAHFNGDYVARDWPLAYAQTMRAASAGLPAAQRNLDLMDHYLLPSDKAKAEQILATLPPIRTRPPVESMAAGAASGAASPSPAAWSVGTAPPTKSAASAGSKAAKARPDTKTVRTDDDSPAGDGSGKWKVQLGAFGSAERVQERWKAMLAKVPEMKRYHQNVASSGRIQRLQATGIASKADAQALCRKVIDAKGDCIVLAP